MGWFCRVKSVLHSQPELWLAYMHGQKFEKLTHMHKNRPKYKGAFVRVFIWFYTLIRQTRLNFNPRANECEYLFYAGTHNQKNSLDKTIDAFREKNENVLAITRKELLSKEDVTSRRYSEISYSLIEIFKSIILMIFRVKSLFSSLNDENSFLITDRLDVFLKVYNNLIYFDRLLNKLNPKFVIVSNDHNVSNMCLLALAREMGLKTVYMQHASTSELFPALNFDYAFLDGQYALQTYRKCEDNLIDTSVLLSNRKIFLSGQKKSLKRLAYTGERTVGIALNALDSLTDVRCLVSFLCHEGFEIRIRWHPSFSYKRVSQVFADLNNQNLEYSNPKDETLSYFFSKIGCLVAGNSSIHLEAGLSQLISIYFEISNTDIPDYYGYVRNGLSISADGYVELAKTIKDVLDRKHLINESAIQLYSASYGTEWEGREELLVVETLKAIKKGSVLPIPPQFL